MTTGCHAMSHRLRLVVDEEVRGAGHELELHAGGVVLLETGWHPSGSACPPRRTARVSARAVGVRSSCRG